ncbi:MAG TPA: peptidoglycan-binding domain-containing protein, partial [Candidatus Binatia bacterium]|nr:peptidoglycan-binding domain-containing protein [Candidatus Binatia bacterium]
SAVLAPESASSEAPQVTEAFRESDGNPAGLGVENLGKTEIRKLQERLRAVGFGPGPADGIFGARTRAAMLKLESGCATLKDLWESSELEMMQQTPAPQAPGIKAALDKFFARQDIRVVQVRLKDVGFDPGNIDGILGPKTASAVIRLHSGCSAVKNLPTTLLDGTIHPERGRAVTAKSGSVFANGFTAESSVRHSSATPSRAGKPLSSREKIRRLQEQLRQAGFDPGPIDGIIGPKTSSALQRYQTSPSTRKSGDGSPNVRVH